MVCTSDHMFLDARICINISRKNILVLKKKIIYSTSRKRMLILADKISYCCSICHVSVRAWPLFDFRAHWNSDAKGLCLEYRGKAELNEKGAEVQETFTDPTD